ncbi:MULTISPECIES: DUF2627 family protein [Exiguobacterium]|uniref:DUF2627 domain-containing protein n=2 Tax=Exiguobacterium TaxID=33986 RepID=U1LXN5_9BACL|nr:MULTISPECIES: DUF2627 family protein [Exiguobacterium]ERG67062.1 hypothetical protein M467_07185 [Exiguobacterium chiriqhucha RW-2]KAB2861876.1 MAG: DUF2627 family protein [Exiguobacterium chiriqhucha]MCT4776537.1 DUF2627 domain-containing protein [Exiguobacterium aquaticum]MCT4788794.1 DUF2627 domain-containing protein [Exiguobacterium mexicanum]MDL5377312.1 DUF2627 family protein [Exiguobacterium mexicanum]
MRIIALLILIIPGLFGVYGIKLLRDSFFLKTSVPFSWIESVAAASMLQGTFGLLIAMGGIGFVAGYIFNRDKKTGKVPRIDS